MRDRCYQAVRCTLGPKRLRGGLRRQRATTGLPNAARRLHKWSNRLGAIPADRWTVDSAEELFHLGADADQLEESAQGASGVPVDNIAARWHSNPVGHIHAHPSITANRGFEPNTAKRLMATLGFSAAIGSLLVPALSDRVGRKPVIVGFSVLGVILPVEAMYLTGGPWALAALFFVGWGVCWSAGATFAEQESKRCAPLSCRVFASH